MTMTNQAPQRYCPSCGKPEHGTISCILAPPSTTEHIHVWLVLEDGLQVCRGCPAHKIVAVEVRPSFQDCLVPRQSTVPYQPKPQAKENPRGSGWLQE